MDDLIELAKRHLEKDRPTNAFFFLALEAIKQLTRIADAQEKIAKLLNDWNEGETVAITMHKPEF